MKKLKLKHVFEMSRALKKMELDFNIDPKAEAEEVGAELLKKIATNAYKAEEELTSIAADILETDPEEIEVVQLLGLLENLSEKENLQAFFKTASKLTK